MFTPEFSTQLWQQVQHTWQATLRPHYPQLQLQRLLDLLEFAEELLELFLKNAHTAANADAADNALTSFIMGAFYIYLVIPQSIQYQTRNKSHTIYNDLKMLYENQTSMTNVLIMVKRQVDLILEDEQVHHQNVGLITRNRAYSVPNYSNNDNTLHNIPNTMSTQLQHLQLNENLPPPPPLQDSNSSHNLSDNENKVVDADQYIDMDDNETLWTAPVLEPNDQLKLATELDYSNDDLVLFDKVTTNTNTNTNTNNRHIIQPVKESEITKDFNTIDTSTNTFNINDIPTDRSLTHRKNSYHSVYMIENDDSMDNNNYYDESNQFIQSLDRLQRQSIITAPELFCILSNPDQARDLLLIDLRLNSRFKKSKIVAPNVLHIDPNLLWNSVNNSPIYEISQLEKLLHNNALFLNRDKFKYIVYFSDTKTFMKLNFDYNFTLFYLLNTSRNKPLHCVPTFLLGSFEKWKKVISNYAKQYNINPDDFILKFSKDHDNANANANNIKRISLIDPTIKKPDVPTLDKSWQPIKVPNRIRKRAPPPPPNKLPESPKVLPKVPIRLKTENSNNNNNTILISTPIPTTIPPPIPNSCVTAPIQFNTYPHISKNNHIITRNNNLDNKYSFTPSPPYSKRSNSNYENSTHYQRPLNRTIINKQQQQQQQQIKTTDRKYSIPTIEKSSNIFTSLSITGLRNLGNTCYINSMLQCLFATTTFRDLFLSSIYRKYLKPERNQNEPQISNSFHILFNKMYLNGGCSVVPISFLKICNILRPDLRIPDDQQDTTEFLMLILDRLHDELSNQTEVVNEYPNLMLYDTEKLNVDATEYKDWFEKTVIGNGLSPIDEIFQGQTENSLQCQRCGHSSNNYSTFYMLSLAIPKPQYNTFSKSKKVSLEDCLNMYMSDEVLSGENAWECPKCCQIKKDYHNAKEKSKLTKQKLKETNSNNNNNTNYLSPTSPTSLSNEKATSRRSRIFKFGSSSSRSSLDHDTHHHRHNNSMNGIEKHKLSRSLSPFRVLGGTSSSSRSASVFTGNSPTTTSYNPNITPLTNTTKDTTNIKQKLKSQNDDLKEIKDEMSKWKTKKLITIKTLNFISLPPILVIHLSRFFYDLTKKNDTLVSYPFHLNIVLKNGDVAKYKLFGLVNHTGNLISGHYTSLVNKDLNHSLDTYAQKWYYFDDETVKEDQNHGDKKKKIDKVYSNNVYVLFYEKIQ